MDVHTLATIGFVVLAAAAVFVTAYAGAVAMGILPAASRNGDGHGSDVSTESGEERSSAARDDADGEERSSAARDDDGWNGSRITAADNEQIRNYLQKDRFHRSPDDLLPSDDERS